jgi:NADH dehydrogenase
MKQRRVHVVTGAFGYSGRYIAQRLLDGGHEVRTLTNSPPPSPYPFHENIQTHPLSFEDEAALAKALAGAAVLYNTYWVRFNHRTFNFASAVENTKKLFAAARRARVERVVHVSITNPSEDSPFEYFRGKAALERTLKESGLSYAVLRPAVLFGKEDILINSIAWMLRKFPVFGVFGDGNYRLQPIYVDDLAKLAAEEGRKTENRVIDAVGPETFTFRGLVEQIGAIIGKKRRIASVPPSPGYIISWLLGKIVGDVVLTREEIGGLMAGLLCTDSPPAGKTKLTDWAHAHAGVLGARYTSELARRAA